MNRTFTEILLDRAEAHPERLAFSLTDGMSNEQISFRTLVEEASLVAAELARICEPGARCVLAMPTCRSYLAGFFGSMLARTVAVPLAEPQGHSRASVQRFENVLDDCVPAVVLTTSAYVDDIEAMPAVRRCGASVVAVDRLTGLAPLPSQRGDDDDIMFLQYTSGSVGNPKGVVIRHRNAVHNTAMMVEHFGITTDSVGVSWLPLFHDMGLVGGLLTPVRGGYPTHLMSPTTMLRRPDVWLRGITEHRATVSGAPNFGYRLCVDKITDDTISELDLSSWDVSFNGAEPVSARVMDRFARRFATAGFRPQAQMACYGMAESTLFVTATPHGSGITVAEFDTDALEHRSTLEAADGAANRTTTLVGHGTPPAGITMNIVNPRTGEHLAPGQIGEIEVSSPSVSTGYWKKHPVEGTGTEDRPLRTGDNGAIVDGDLFVTGRSHDLIIVAGRNIYPQDVETAVQESHEAFIPDFGAAFSVTEADGDRLVVVQAVDRRRLATVKAADLVGRIRTVLTNEFGVKADDVVLLPTGRIPRTTSGKIQRSRARAEYRQHRYRKHRLNPAVPSGEMTATDRADELSASVRGFLEHRTDRLLMDERRTLAPHVVLELGNRGVLGLEAPSRLGGAELSKEESLRVIAEIASVDLSIATFVGIHNALGLRPILEYGTPAQIDSWGRDAASGRILAGYAITEPGAGSNPTAITTTARRQADGSWLINGTKNWIGNAAWSGVLTVIARTEEEGAPTGTGAFLVPSSAPGVRNGAEALTMGVRSIVQNVVHLDDVRLDSNALLGGARDGMRIAQDIMGYGRLGIAAMAVGGMRRAIWYARTYASNRHISTGLLLDNGVTLDLLDGWLSSLHGTADLVATIGRSLDRNEPLTAEATAACKIVASERLWEVVDGAMQLLGARGYVENSLLPQLLRDARLFRVFEGPTETLAAHLGGRLLRTGHLPGIAAQSDKELAATAQIARDACADDPALRHRLSHALGLAAAEGYVVSNLDPTVDERSTRWNRDRFRAACDRVRELAPTSMPCSADLRARLDRHLGHLPALTPPPGTDRSVDDHLVPETNRFVSRTPVPTAPPAPPHMVREPLAERAAPPSPDVDLLETVTDCLALTVKVAPRDIDLDKPFAEYGLDSVDAIELAQQLGERLGIEIDPVTIYDHPTARILAVRLREHVDQHTDVPAGDDHAATLTALREELNEVGIR
ncbi:AMP-binding protein [Nocardiopsis tropica]|uniref:AMP-binding protein n=1 Tax=Nocardiopsis tropica TaxID=109330 RepID=A0ABU7KKC5_9ACTN|nr:AMP-binding protein [Nocardiopsis umidischolae]MEE2049748.1 AMP-binding protein [Nocardiopsis umidischolae]